MKKLALAVALLGLLVAGQGAQAIIGTVDDVPAATLLLPYFETTQPGAPNVFHAIDGIYVGDATVVADVQELLTGFGITSFVAGWDTPCPAGSITPLRLTEPNFNLAMFESKSTASATWAPPVAVSWTEQEMMYHARLRGYVRAVANIDWTTAKRFTRRA